MKTLRVTDFSCIDEATLEISRMTVLIGPQASGKSVLSKLSYFFLNVLTLQYSAIEDGKSLPQFQAELEETFKEWFPPSAWGKKRFVLEFEAGPFSVRIARSLSRKTASNNIRITLSEYFAKHYNENLEFLQKGMDKSKSATGDVRLNREFDLFWRMRQGSERRLVKDLKEDYVSYQVFVPAGRSFFTSIGKAVAAFEQGGMLDPLTIRFGRLFASLRERQGRGRYLHSPNVKTDVTYKALSTRLFGGEVKFARDKEYVETTDGRTIPFSALSSGQQELLPLWMTLDFYADADARNSLIYIEEPEAHLFPSAQNLLMQYLAAMSNIKSKTLLMTTHSPYMLSKVNTLLKAGLLGEQLKKSHHQQIATIVPKEAWLLPGTTRAYAIKDRKLVSILDRDGTIDGAYLDEVSGEIERDFSALLEIQYPDDPDELGNPEQAEGMA